MTHATLALLPGDGIGPEVMHAATQVLDAVAALAGHTFTYREALIGGVAIDATGEALPAATITTCEQADAVLLGAVGGPQWSDPGASVRPEQGLLGLRKHFGLFANLRPVRGTPALAEHAPLRADLLADVDLLFVRELTGGLYFGPRQEEDAQGCAYDTMLYTVPEVQRVARVAFAAARGRRGHLTSVDKANVLASSRLWRRTITALHQADYADVTLEHALVDSCAMHLLTRPASFDVIVTENLFGDILSDEASVLAGSLGMLPSASLGEGTFGVYEPVHGSAPDIAGQGKANPVAMILSAAMLLRHSLGLEAEATRVEATVDAVIAAGACTADIAARGAATASTTEFTQAVLGALR